ncbi:MAG: hypothetical protein R3E56_21555 [Burkholderiaceae bacterium]
MSSPRLLVDIFNKAKSSTSGQPQVAGAKAQYAWVVKGGEVNFDTHGDAPGKSISYEKGRGVASDEGVLEAAFTGNHGWFWRNRGQSDVQLVLRTRGDYSEIKNDAKVAQRR